MVQSSSSSTTTGATTAGNNTNSNNNNSPTSIYSSSQSQQQQQQLQQQNSNVPSPITTSSTPMTSSAATTVITTTNTSPTSPPPTTTSSQQSQQSQQQSQSHLRHHHHHHHSSTTSIDSSSLSSSTSSTNLSAAAAAVTSSSSSSTSQHQQHQQLQQHQQQQQNYQYQQQQQLSHSISVADEHVKDYLHYRGFNETMRAFDKESRQDPSKNFSCEKIVEQLFFYCKQYDIIKCMEYWRYLEKKYFVYMSLTMPPPPTSSSSSSSSSSLSSTMNKNGVSEIDDDNGGENGSNGYGGGNSSSASSSAYHSSSFNNNQRYNGVWDTVRKLEQSLKKFYIVNCVQTNRMDKCRDFFEEFGLELVRSSSSTSSSSSSTNHSFGMNHNNNSNMGNSSNSGNSANNSSGGSGGGGGGGGGGGNSSADGDSYFLESLQYQQQQQQDEWRDWFIVPFLKPSEIVQNSKLEPYFQKNWIEMLYVSLYNFISSALMRAEKPMLLTIESEQRDRMTSLKRKVNLLMNENESLRSKLIAAEMYIAKLEKEAGIIRDQIPVQHHHHHQQMNPSNGTTITMTTIHTVSGTDGEENENFNIGDNTDKSKNRQFGTGSEVVVDHESERTSDVGGENGGTNGQSTTTMELNRDHETGNSGSTRKTDDNNSNGGNSRGGRRRSSVESIRIRSSSTPTTLQVNNDGTTPTLTGSSSSGNVRTPQKTKQKQESNTSFEDATSPRSSSSNSASSQHHHQESSSEGVMTPSTARRRSHRDTYHDYARLRQLQPKKTLSGHKRLVTQCKFNSEGTAVATSSLDRYSRVWSLSTSTCVAFDCGAPALSVEWIKRNENLLLSGTSTGKIRICNTENGKFVSEAVAENMRYRNICDLASCPTNGNSCIVSCINDEASGSFTGILLGYNLKQMKVCDRFALEPDVAVSTVSFNHNGSMFVAAANDGVIRVYDAKRSAPIMKWRAHNGYVTSVQFSRNETTILSTGTDGRIVQWSAHHEGKILDEITPDFYVTNSDGVVNQFCNPNFLPKLSHMTDSNEMFAFSNPAVVYSMISKKPVYSFSTAVMSALDCHSHGHDEVKIVGADTETNNVSLFSFMS